MRNFTLSGVDLESAPIVQQKKKYATFTVTEIGGPVEIEKWRAEQAKKWAHSAAMREELKERQKEFLSKDAPDGDAVTWVGKASVGAADWQDKLAFALSERKRLAAPEPASGWQWTLESEPKQTFLQKIKGWITGLWNSANA